MPVITPWELEIGLGAREWQAYYSLDIGRLFSCLDSKDFRLRCSLESMINEDEVDLRNIMDRIRHTFSIESDDTTNETLRDEDGKESRTLIQLDSERRLVITSDNILSEKFLSRSYQGLLPHISADEEMDTTIKQGQFGTSVAYK